MLVNDLSYDVDDELVHLSGSKKRQPLRHRSLLHLPAASPIVYCLLCSMSKGSVTRSQMHSIETKENGKIDAN
jgi:hypothetical protein